MYNSGSMYQQSNVNAGMNAAISSRLANYNMRKAASVSKYRGEVAAWEAQETEMITQDTAAVAADKSDFSQALEGAGLAGAFVAPVVNYLGPRGVRAVRSAYRGGKGKFKKWRESQQQGEGDDTAFDQSGEGGGTDLQDIDIGDHTVSPEEHEAADNFEAGGEDVPAGGGGWDGGAVDAANAANPDYVDPGYEPTSFEPSASGSDAADLFNQNDVTVDNSSGMFSEDVMSPGRGIAAPEEGVRGEGGGGGYGPEPGPTEEGGLFEGMEPNAPLGGTDEAGSNFLLGDGNFPGDAAGDLPSSAVTYDTGGPAPSGGGGEGRLNSIENWGEPGTGGEGATTADPFAAGGADGPLPAYEPADVPAGGGGEAGYGPGRNSWGGEADSDAFGQSTGWSHPNPTHDVGEYGGGDEIATGGTDVGSGGGAAAEAGDTLITPGAYSSEPAISASASAGETATTGTAAGVATAEGGGGTAGVVGGGGAAEASAAAAGEAAASAAATAEAGTAAAIAAGADAAEVTAAAAATAAASAVATDAAVAASDWWNPIGWGAAAVGVGLGIYAAVEANKASEAEERKEAADKAAEAAKSRAGGYPQGPGGVSGPGIAGNIVVGAHSAWATAY